MLFRHLWRSDESCGRAGRRKPVSAWRHEIPHGEQPLDAWPPQSDDSDRRCGRVCHGHRPAARLERAPWNAYCGRWRANRSHTEDERHSEHCGSWTGRRQRTRRDICRPDAGNLRVLGGTRQVAGAVSTFLRTIGLTEWTRQVAAADLAEAHWKAQGAKLREIVLGAQDVDADRFNIIFSKLVVVPDGALWYLPFEALCLPAMASEVEEVNADEEETPTDAKTGVLQSSDAVNGVETQEDGAEKENAEEEESDLDSVYRATEEEEDQLEQEEEVTETFSKELNESEDPKEETEDDSKEVKTETEAAPEPKKRKPRSAREREELEQYEATLIPMIQASELTIRYSATVSLALPNALGRNAFVETTVAAGVSYPREPAERMEAAVDRFATAIPKTEAFRIGSLPIPGSIYAARLKRLVVFNEIQGDIWNWEPVTPGKTRG